MMDWRGTGEVVRARVHRLLSELARRRFEGARRALASIGQGEPAEVLLIGISINLFREALADDCDPRSIIIESEQKFLSRLKVQLRTRSFEEDKAYFLALNSRPGRPRSDSVRLAATFACLFYDAWRGENQKRGIKDYGHRRDMKDWSAEVIVSDLFGWRFGVGVHAKFVGEMGKFADVESLT